MLSSGTRIGPNRVSRWLSDGSCGQSYECELTEGDEKGETRYVKLLPREISERKGFGDYFHQECQALQQLEGAGIWPILDFGVMKWKHWISYSLFEGDEFQVESSGEEESGNTESVKLRTLSDWIEYNPGAIRQEVVLQIMIELHRGLHRAHLAGFLHGNLKPSNILVKPNGDAWITEFGLMRISSFSRKIAELDGEPEVNSMTLEAQESLAEGDRFKPAENIPEEANEEDIDIFALGTIVRWIVEKVGNESGHWDEWLVWAEQACSLREFRSVAHSMEAMPGVGDISEYGIVSPSRLEDSKIDPEEIRIKREREWALSEKRSSLQFRRNMTAFAGLISLTVFLISSVYLFFFPSPWTEYKMDGVLDSYQLGAGLWGGQAWGIVPAAYDDDGGGGQDVVGSWEKEDGLFKLNFRKFKKPDDEKSDKKLWQFIGQGKTSSDDYHNWTDFISYDRSRDVLLLTRRVDKTGTFLPGREGESPPRLYPKQRFSRGEKVDSAELTFLRVNKSGSNWALFFCVGFLLAAFIYHRALGRLLEEAGGND